MGRGKIQNNKKIHFLDFLKMSVHLVIDKILQTSDFGVQLTEHFTEEKEKLVGTQVCFSRVTHDKSLEWFKLDEVLFFYLC